MQGTAWRVAAGIEVEPVFRDKPAIGGDPDIVHIFVASGPAYGGGNVEAVDIIVEVQHNISIDNVVTAVDGLEATVGVV